MYARDAPPAGGGGEASSIHFLPTDFQCAQVARTAMRFMTTDQAVLCLAELVAGWCQCLLGAVEVTTVCAAGSCGGPLAQEAERAALQQLASVTASCAAG